MQSKKYLATALIIAAIAGAFYTSSIGFGFKPLAQPTMATGQYTLSMAENTSSISQHGITWTFDKEYKYGQFVNGDYWVVGPATIVGIDPASTNIAGRTMNGAMINPNGDNDNSGDDTSNTHGFDSLAGGFDGSLNVARPGGNDLTASNPLAIGPGASLVSSKSFVENKGGYGQLEDFAVLTVLSEVPPDNSFRPAYASPTKEIKYNLSDIDFEALSDLAIAGSNAPNLNDVIEWFRYPCIAIAHDGTSSVIGGNRCSQHDTYTERIGKATLLLNCNFTDAEKQTPLVHILQNGIDRHGVLTNGGRKLWRGNGAFHMGIKLTIMFTAKVLGDEEMLSDITNKSGDYWEDGEYGRQTWPAITLPPDLYYFSEDNDTLRISSWDILSVPYPLMVATGRKTTAGTVKVTNGSKTVIGVGTSFLSSKHEKFGEDYKYGTWFASPGDNQAYSTTGRAYDIEEFVSNTEITLKEPYTGDTDQPGNLAYALSSVIFYGHGGWGVSNPPNYYRGLDFNETGDSYLNWPDWMDSYYISGGHGIAPYKFSIGYRGNCSRNYGSQALPALIMGLKTAWNHNVFFDYTDRYIAWARNEGGSDFQDHFTEDMWNAYRTDYSCVWVGDESTQIWHYDCSECLHDCLSSPYCGDGSCNGSEDNTSCAHDCGECEEGATRQCGTTDTGECAYGTQTCTTRSWGECLGAINPTIEACTGDKDEDCDSLIDCADPDCTTNPACTTECIDEPALAGFITEWKQGSMQMLELMQKMKAWKTGTGCPL